MGVIRLDGADSTAVMETGIIAPRVSVEPAAHRVETRSQRTTPTVAYKVRHVTTCFAPSSPSPLRRTWDRGSADSERTRSFSAVCSQAHAETKRVATKRFCKRRRPLGGGYCSGVFELAAASNDSNGSESGSDLTNTSSKSGKEDRMFTNINISETASQAAAQAANAASQAASAARSMVENPDSLGVFRSFFLFAGYFVALLSLVRRSIMAATHPYERVLLSALAIALPDLARNSFSNLSQRISALREKVGESSKGVLERNAETARTNEAGEDKVEKSFPRHAALASFTSLMTLLGFWRAGFSRISSGAVLVALSRVFFDAAVQFKWVNGSAFMMRRENRTFAMVFDFVLLSFAVCCHIQMAPVICSFGFLLMVCSYHLSKYDIELVTGRSSPRV
ncbi:hypothetical protein FVE85_0265 [Porphyridium purpureum]|uniref:Uncharacterized protein n=1 Tax=Porphyridium purpureum TaxID=35688 RepID=A0A5J4YYZ7_PORPP|nr:hypothetical protein FVE85_0265 [Porphyridium purpureum]|eukprot:POR7829..scf208_2